MTQLSAQEWAEKYGRCDGPPDCQASGDSGICVKWHGPLPDERKWHTVAVLPRGKYRVEERDDGWHVLSDQDESFT